LKDSQLTQPLLASSLIHILAILLVSTAMSRTARLLPKDFLPIGLVDLPPATRQSTMEKKEQEPLLVKRTPPPPKVAKTKEAKPVGNADAVEAARPVPPPALRQPQEEPTMEAKAPAPLVPQTPRAMVEGGGSPAGTGNLFGKGNVAVVPGSGTTGGGGGTASLGLGRSSGTPGLPLPTAILRTNREAKPLQTVRASYPAMALRMGMEGDVTLKIEVDSEGKVTKAEIVRSAGAGFDEEALKAVKQARFEPAQKDGTNVPAEFTYIYRFRLRK
jgi:protein TonB